MVEIRVFRPSDSERVVALWSLCGLIRPWNDPKKDIERKLRVQPELFLVALADGELVGSVMAGYDGHRGWMYYLAVAPECQRQGIGRQLAEEVEKRLSALGCAKVNLMVREDNFAAAGFYGCLGYHQDRVISFGKRIESDDPEHT